MNNRRFFLAGVSAVTGLALTGCEKLKKTVEDTAILLTPNKGSKRWPNYRYRLTVEVDTPEGVKSGSTVIEVETAMSGPNNIPTPGSLYRTARGEAVTVDLGTRGLLFALIQSEWAANALMSTVTHLTPDEMRNLPEGTSEFEILMKRLMAVPYEQERPLPRYIQFGVVPPALSGPPNGYPILVRFDDPALPKTVELVDADNLAASFGKGVQLRSVTVARTETAMTSGIVNRLPWLKTLRGGLAKVPPMSSAEDVKDLSLAFHLSDADFSYGVIK